MAIQFGTLKNANMTATESQTGIGEVSISGQFTSAASTDAVSLFNEVYAALPGKGSTITIAGSQLALTNREVTIVDVGYAEVNLTFLEVIQAGGPLNASFSIAGALQTIKTARDKDGDDVSVTFNDDVQGGEFDVQIPQTTLTFDLVEELASPFTYSHEWVGTVNDGSWAGGAVGTWMCVAVNVEPFNADADPPTYRVQYQFQYDPDGWDPEVVYIDPETSKPPPGWAAAVGASITVEYYEPKDFSAKFAV